MYGLYASKTLGSTMTYYWPQPPDYAVDNIKPMWVATGG